MSFFEINSNKLQLSDIEHIIDNKIQIKLSDESTSLIQGCRDYLDKKISTNTEPIYGINTGFGSLYKESISNSELNTLQENIIKSHACGTGDSIPSHIVKLILLLKVKSLSFGHSGVQVATVQRLIDMFNDDVLPVIYQFGSLGASGDLAPLAHLSLPLLGLGKVEYQGKVISGEELNKVKGWQPINLMAKEGLALLNGTQFMSAYGIWNTLTSSKLIRLANLIGAAAI
ncbi:MAG: histidine ammonia-lyase, partial [Bacteroidetes bacterium]